MYIPILVKITSYENEINLFIESIEAILALGGWLVEKLIYNLWPFSAMNLDL